MVQSEGVREAVSVTTIEHLGRTLARVLRFSDWQEGLAFHSSDDDFIQVGTWHYPAGKELQTHYHLQTPRTIGHTQEVVVVMAGSVEAVVATTAGEEVARVLLGAGDVIVLLEGAHGYRVLEPDTRVVEVKNGPYLGAEQDRARV
jgi:hypothetical protein